MYRVPKAFKTTLSVNDSKEGETIEDKVRRINMTGEAITDGAPLFYTEREEGVLPEMNIRTEWIDLAVEAGDRNTKEKLAKRAERINAKDKTDQPGEGKPTE